MRDRVERLLLKPGVSKAVGVVSAVVAGTAVMLAGLAAALWLLGALLPDIAALDDRFKAWAAQPAQRGDLVVTAVLCLWLGGAFRSSKRPPDPPATPPRAP
ncbi:MAG TPA: hypothetical protein VJ140_10130 [Actinomycetota bacterium]|nr:hypothetical protein [Actinomycetota bacterium]